MDHSDDNHVDFDVKKYRNLVASKYLAAGAYRNARFRKKVFFLQSNPLRSPAPEIGIDRSYVLHHCQMARKRIFYRDLVLFSLFLMIFWLSDLFMAIQYPNYADQILSENIGAILIINIIGFFIVITALYQERHIELNDQPDKKSATDTTIESSKQNVIVYGGFSPFVGSGIDIGGWSFSINLNMRKTTDAANPKNSHFGVEDLYTFIKTTFNLLEIDNMTVADKIFVDGRSIRLNKDFFSEDTKSPIHQVNFDIIKKYIGGSGSIARHYLCTSIVAWDGECVISNFLRIKKTKSSLFIESSNFLLPPLLPEFHDIDKYIPGLSFLKIREILLQSIVHTPFLIAFSPLNVLIYILQPFSLRKTVANAKKEAFHNAVFNYGAITSIRELGSDKNWRIYFQKLDREMYSKILQQQLLDAIVEFLSNKGIDTSEIKERRSYIINQGLIISGGTIKAESLAVGEAAQAQTIKSKAQAGKTE